MQNEISLAMQSVPVPASFRCPMTLEVMRDPIVTHDGQATHDGQWATTAGCKRQACRENEHGQLASPTRATRGAQLEWQWGHVLTVPLPADDRHKVPDEDSVLQCGLCGTPRQVRARKSDKNRVGPFFAIRILRSRGCYENSENLKWGQGSGTRIQFQEDPKKWRWDL